ncbi:unnamed protein product, partial [marine sediment metagenome]
EHKDKTKSWEWDKDAEHQLYFRKYNHGSKI